MKGTRITTMALANKESDSEFDTTDEDEENSSEERTMSQKKLIRIQSSGVERQKKLVSFRETEALRNQKKDDDKYANELTEQLALRIAVQQITLDSSIKITEAIKRIEKNQRKPLRAIAMQIFEMVKNKRYRVNA